jgi:hypothetical protein
LSCRYLSHQPPIHAGSPAEAIAAAADHTQAHRYLKKYPSSCAPQKSLFLMSVCLSWHNFARFAVTSIVVNPRFILISDNEAMGTSPFIEPPLTVVFSTVFFLVPFWEPMIQNDMYAPKRLLNGH